MLDLLKKFQNFCNCESGAVTVDFVVLTAAICLLGLTVVNTFNGETTDLANEIGETVRTAQDF